MKRVNSIFGAIGALLLILSCEKESTSQPQRPVIDNKAYVGTMTVDQNDGTSFTQEAVSVTFDIVDDAHMTIVMDGAKFAAAMPMSLTMTIANVEYSSTSTGYTLSGNNIVPEAMGGPFEQFTITNLSGNISVDSMTLDFICGAYPVTFTGSIK